MNENKGHFLIPGTRLQGCAATASTELPAKLGASDPSSTMAGLCPMALRTRLRVDRAKKQWQRSETVGTNESESARSRGGCRQWPRALFYCRWRGEGNGGVPFLGPTPPTAVLAVSKKVSFIKNSSKKVAEAASKGTKAQSLQPRTRERAEWHQRAVGPLLPVHWRLARRFCKVSFDCSDGFLIRPPSRGESSSIALVVRHQSGARFVFVVRAAITRERHGRTVCG